MFLAHTYTHTHTAHTHPQCIWPSSLRKHDISNWVCQTIEVHLHGLLVTTLLARHAVRANKLSWFTNLNKEVIARRVPLTNHLGAWTQYTSPVHPNANVKGHSTVQESMSCCPVTLTNIIYMHLCFCWSTCVCVCVVGSITEDNNVFLFFFLGGGGQQSQRSPLSLPFHWQKQTGMHPKSQSHVIYSFTKDLLKQQSENLVVNGIVVPKVSL